MFYSALLGDPVEHSVSPILFGYLAEQAGLEYAHIKIRIPAAEKLGRSLRSLKELGFCGVNITLPYKLSVIKNLNGLSPEAKKMGAVNAVVFTEEKMIGHNTDAQGAFMAIEKKLKPIKAGDRVLVIGAGGAARAIIAGISKKCKNIVILNRDLKEADKVIKDLSFGGGEALKLNEENIKKYLADCNIVVNATPVGMYPKSGDEIISREVFRSLGSLKGKYFFDAIFNPYQTKFLTYAMEGDAGICSGMYMMIFQAIAAFRLWTGIKLENVDVEKINKKLAEAITP